MNEFIIEMGNGIFLRNPSILNDKDRLARLAKIIARESDCMIEPDEVAAIWKANFDYLLKCERTN